MCADIYAHFHFELGDSSYYPSGAQQLFHPGTCSWAQQGGYLEMFNWPIWCCRVVFATIALGMEINLKDVNTIYQYGAPKSIWWLFPGESPRRMEWENAACSWSFRLSSKEVANKLKRWRGSSCEEVLGEWHCMSSTVTTRPFWPDLSKPEHLLGCDLLETDTE